MDKQRAVHNPLTEDISYLVDLHYRVKGNITLHKC